MDLISSVGRESVRYTALSKLVLVRISLQHHFFFINVEKVKRQFLSMFGNVPFVLICIFKPFFFFSNHYFSFPTLKITTEAVSPFGNTFSLFKEWKRLYKISKFNGSQLAKMKRVFLTCPCHNIYRDEAAGLKSCKCTWKITIFVNMWNLGQFREKLIFCQ